MAKMYLTRSLAVTLPSGMEFTYNMDENSSAKGKKTIESIMIYPTNILVNFKDGGPLCWMIANLAAFSYDKELVAIDTDAPTIGEPKNEDKLKIESLDPVPVDSAKSISTDKVQ